MLAKRLTADYTSRVRFYGDYPSKLESRLDTVNRESTLNLKITNWENTPIHKLNIVEFFLNAKRHHILIQLHRIFAFYTL